LNCNFLFAPKGFRHGRLRYPFVEFVNSVLIRRILDPLDSGKPGDEKLADDLWTWTQENIHLRSDLNKLYEVARKDRKAKAKAKTLAIDERGLTQGAPFAATPHMHGRTAPGAAAARSRRH
jgi:hypothetical protein